MSFGLSRVDFTEGMATREAFGEALAEAGSDDRIVVVDGDVNNSTFTNKFAEKYPERFFNVGIAESNLVGIAAGLAAAGKIPVAASFSIFLMANASIRSVCRSLSRTSTSSSWARTRGSPSARTVRHRWRSRTWLWPAPSPGSQ